MNYLIMTEQKNPDQVKSILDMYFDGFTILAGEGRWKGKTEPSMVILLCDVDAGRVQNACEEIKSLNDQEAVMIMEFRADISFI